MPVASAAAKRRDIEMAEITEKTEILDRVLVSHGKTVYCPHPTKTTIIGQGEDGKLKRAPLLVAFAPGDAVELTPDEARRLIALGTVHREGEQPLVGGIRLAEARSYGTREHMQRG
jgi:hypothetical protein